MKWNIIGDVLIRVGVLKSWEVVDKIGVGLYVIWNDIVIFWLFKGDLIVFVIFFNCMEKDVEYNDKLIVEVVK